MTLFIRNEITSEGKIEVVCGETGDVVYECESVIEAVDMLESEKG